MKAVVQNDNYVLKTEGHKYFYLIRDIKSKKWVDRDTLKSLSQMGAVSNIIFNGNTFKLIKPKFDIKELDKNIYNRLSKYLRKCMQEIIDIAKKEGWDDYSLSESLDFYEYWLNPNKIFENKRDVKILMYGNLFVGFVNKSSILDVPVISFSSFRTEWVRKYEISDERIYSYLFDVFPISVFQVYSVDDIYSLMEHKGIQRCTLNSVYNTEYRYICDFGSEPLFSRNKYVIRNAIEKEINKKRGLFNGHLNFSLLSQTQLDEKLQKEEKSLDGYRGCWTTHNGLCIKTGFTYFDVVELNSYWNRDKELYFLIAEDDFGNIVGLIKYGYYGEGEFRHLALAYVDVHCLYRKKGIATKLFEELNKYLKKDEIFELSIESEMGKLCHMHKLAKSKLYNAKVLTDEEYRDYCMHKFYKGKT